MSSVRFHGYSFYTCSYYRFLFLVCHQLGSMAIVCIHVVNYRSLFLVCHQLGSMDILCIHVVTIGHCS